LRCAVIRVAA
jgi:hypothetical protein